MRTEFGVERSTCACRECKTNCRFIPGYLIPADLTRMIPERPEGGVLAWAERNLLASPGARVLGPTGMFDIPTLVPATKTDGSCRNLEAGRCTIHEVAPFGCAFFSCRSSPRIDGEDLSNFGLRAVLRDFRDGGLYSQLWRWLDAKGLRAESPATKRQRMKEHGRR